MEITFSEILSYAVPAVTAVIGWFAGKKKRNNGMLHDMQASIDLLAQENKELMSEVVELRKENAEFSVNQIVMQNEIVELRKENARLLANQTVMQNKIEQLKIY